MRLNPYGDCMNPCKDCPVVGLNAETKGAVNAMASLFDRSVEDALPMGSDAQMLRTAEVIADVVGAPSDHAPLIAKAVGKITVRDTNSCPYTARFSGA